MSTNRNVTININDTSPLANTAYVDSGKENKVYNKAQVNELLEDVREGTLGSISPSQTLQQLNSLPDGNYYASEAGTYAFGVTVPNGWQYRFNKTVATWKVLTKVQIPMQDLTAIETKVNNNEKKVDEFIRDFAVEVDQNFDVNSKNAISANAVVKEFYEEIISSESDVVGLLTPLKIDKSKSINDSTLAISEAIDFDVHYYSFTKDLYLNYMTYKGLSRTQKVYFCDASYSNLSASSVLFTDGEKVKKFKLLKSLTSKVVVAINVQKTDIDFKIGTGISEAGEVQFSDKIKSEKIPTISKIESLTDRENAINSNALNDFIDGHFKEDSEAREENIRSFPNATSYTDYPIGIIQESTGLIINTTNELRRWSGYIDVTNFTQIKMIWSTNYSQMQIAFFDSNHSPILPIKSNLSTGVLVDIPDNCKYIAHNVYTGVDIIDYTNYSVLGIRYTNKYVRNTNLTELINSVKLENKKALQTYSEKYDLNFVNFAGNNVIDINSVFRSGTQQERIQQALDFAEGKFITLILGEDTINKTNTWSISSSLLIGSKTALLMSENIKIKFSKNGIVDNIIRNKGIKTINEATLHSSDYMRGTLTTQQNDNIIIRGAGLDKSFIEGSDIAYNAPRPNGSSGGAKEDWVGDNYGWRSVSILLTNVKNAEVGGFHLSKTKGWGVFFENVQNFYKHDIYVNSENVKNGDGGDSMMGTSNGLVKNIQGVTFDDLYLVSNIPRDRYINYPDYSRYIYPMYAGLLDFKDKDFSEQDVHDIDVQDLMGSSKTITLRLLATMGSKVYNININNVTSVNKGYSPYSILSIETGYNINGGQVAQVGDMYNISVNNVVGSSIDNKTVVKIPLRDSWLNSIQKMNSTIGVNFVGYAQDKSVKVTNLK